jgi:hypothetical protein
VRRRLIFLVGVLGFSLVAIPCHAESADSITKSSTETFKISLTLENERVKREAVVELDMPFEVTTFDRRGKTTLSGVLHKPKDDVYALTLAISKLMTADSTSTERYETNLTLDQPVRLGYVQSIGYRRTVTLHKSPN